ncbi:MAG: Rieske 2Fe-2S domain-containing protein [Cyanobacteria bacterium J06650_10]
MAPPSTHRRRFLKYLIGSSATTVAASWLWPATISAQKLAQSEDLEELCLQYPFNARCENYLPGVAALDDSEVPYEEAAILATAEIGDRIQADGLDKPAYLVIEEGPAIATYAISALCPHLGCTVDWNAAEQKFICPCHGSQFDSDGEVARGPASQGLSLVTVVVKDDQVRLVDREPES